MDLVPEGYTKDPETGYLVSNRVRVGVPFGIETKKKFLEVMEEEGNVAGVCKMLGVSDRSLYDHLAIDEAFKRDYALCVRRMANRLEGTMYKNGQRPQGYMDRITFLRRWFPNEWTPKTSVTVTNDTADIDTLFSTLQAQGKLVDTTLAPDSDSPSV